MICIENLLVSKETLNEKLYSPSVAIGYHRTRADNFLELLKNSGGFQPGFGMYHGEGLYCTRELEDQLKPGMENQYGSYIVKFKIPIKNYLIFDKEEAKQVYGKNWNIKDQFQLINGKGVKIDTRKKIYKEIEKHSKDNKILFDKTFDKLPSEQKQKFEDLFKDYFLMGFVPINQVFGFEETPYEVERFKNYVTKLPKVSVLSKTNGQFDIITRNVINYYDDIKLEYINNEGRTTVIVLLSHNFTPQQKKEQEINYMVEFLQSEFENNNKYTGYLSRFFAKEAPDELKENVQGVIYTGEQDGRCIVAYNYEECIPLSGYTNRVLHYTEEKKISEFSMLIKLSVLDYLKVLETRIADRYNEIKKSPIGDITSFALSLEEESKELTKLKELMKNNPNIDLMEMFLKNKGTFPEFDNILDPLQFFFMVLVHRQYVTPIENSGKYILHDSFLMDYNIINMDTVIGTTASQSRLRRSLKKHHKQFFGNIKTGLQQVQKSGKELLQYFIQEAKKEKSREGEIE